MGILDSLQFELILIPRYCRALLYGVLQESGIEITYSNRKPPRTVKKSASVHQCRENNASVDFLILPDELREAQLSNYLSILLFPSQVSWFNTKKQLANKQLREKVRTVLYSLKNDERCNVVRKLEDTFLTELRLLSEKFRTRYPDYSFNVWSSPVGSLTPLQGHNLGLECIFPDTEKWQADCVAIIIGVAHLTTEPVFQEAGVGWGAGETPSFKGMDLIENSPPFTDESLAQIHSQFGTLSEAFEKAIESWKAWQPSNHI